MFSKTYVNKYGGKQVTMNQQLWTNPALSNPIHLFLVYYSKLVIEKFDVVQVTCLLFSWMFCGLNRIFRLPDRCMIFVDRDVNIRRFLKHETGCGKTDLRVGEPQRMYLAHCSCDMLCPLALSFHDINVISPKMALFPFG